MPFASEWLYRRLYARPPRAREVEVGLAALSGGRQSAPANVAWEQYCQVLLCANEFVYVD